MPVLTMAARRTLGETRTLILDAGLELLREERYSLVITEVSLIDACRRAGLRTAGSGYKIWPNQQDFRTDLLRYALAASGDAMVRTDRSAAAIEQVGDDPSLSTLIRVASTENAASTIGTAEYFLNHALWLASGRDPELRARYIEAQRDVLGTLSGLYEGLLAVYDREMVPPFTVEMMALAIAAQIDGLSSFCSYVDDVGVERIVRPTGPGGEPEDWHLFGCVTEAIVAAFTRPKTAEREPSGPT
jgi:hypothetical protein